MKAATIIWIEPVKRPGGSNCYPGRNGLLLRTRLRGPDGEIICDRVQNAVCETCRVLMSRGITGPFETWKAGIQYACMKGDIEMTAELTVSEPDIRGRDCQPRFVRWRPYPTSQNAVPLHSVDAPAREDEEGGRGGSRYGIVSSSAAADLLGEAAE